MYTVSHTYCHTYYYWYSITHSLFHSRLKSFLFCKSSLPPDFPFSHSGFTIWISQTVYFTSEHIRLFTFYFFCFLHFLVVGSVRQIKLTYVGFRAHVKIASRIVSYRSIQSHLRPFSATFCTVHAHKRLFMNFRCKLGHRRSIPPPRFPVRVQNVGHLATFWVDFYILYAECPPYFCFRFV